jgi:hypothetical protein
MNTKEIIMKRSTIANTLAIAALTALALGIAPTAMADNKGCSDADLKGTWAFTGTGAIVGSSKAAGPFAEVGTQTFDGRGTTTYSATLSGNGNITPVTATGTYSVNPDCTGTMTVLVAPFGSTVHIFFVLDDLNTEFRAIETETGYVITRIARRQFPQGDWRQ